MEDGKTDETDKVGEEVNSTDSLFEKTDAAAARIEAANKKQEELLNRQEELYAKQKLGGTSTAGQEPEPIKEDTPTEYVDKVMKGEVGDDKG